MENQKQIINWKEYKSTKIYYKPWKNHKNGQSIFNQVFIKDTNHEPAKVFRPKLEGVKNNQDIAWRKSLPIVKEYFHNKSEIEKKKKTKVSNDIMMGDILNDYFDNLVSNIKADVKQERTTERRAKKNLSSNLSYLELLNKHFGNISIKDISLKNVDGYVNTRRIKGVTDGSIGTELRKIASAVQAMLDIWDLSVDELKKHKDDYIYLSCIKSIINHVKEKRGLYSTAIKEAITYQEYLCTIKTITNDKSIDSIYDPVFLYMYFTGARCGEIFELEWYMIDFKKKEICLPQSLIKESKKKSNKTKRFTTVKEVWQMLERLKENKTTDLVFVKKKDGQPIEHSYLYTWDKIRRACNIVYSANKKLYKKARNYRNVYVDNARQAEHITNGSMTATGHSNKMEKYYADDWKSHLRFIDSLEQWKAGQEKKYGVPDREEKNEFADIINSSLFD